MSTARARLLCMSLVVILPTRIEPVRLNPSFTMTNQSNRKQLAREAKAIVALAFRNGPLEDLHAGKSCPACEGKAGFIRITDEEMKAVMKNAVDHVYALLCLKNENPAEYETQMAFGERYTVRWDEPGPVKSREAQPSGSRTSRTAKSDGSA